MSLLPARGRKKYRVQPGVLGHILPGLAALILLCAPALAEDAKPAAGKADESILVDGNRRVDASTVRSYFHADASGRYDEAARDAALKALIATRLFDKVSVDRSGEKLIVHVH